MSYHSPQEMEKMLAQLANTTEIIKSVWHPISETDRKTWERINEKLNNPLPAITVHPGDLHQITIEEYLNRAIDREFEETFKEMLQPSTSARPGGQPFDKTKLEQLIEDIESGKCQVVTLKQRTTEQT